MVDIINQERRKSIILLRVEHPEWVLREIGEAVGVTRERVRQILNQHNLPTKAYRRFKYGFDECPRCGGTKRVKGETCKPCRQEIRPPWVTLTCIVCGNDFERIGAEHRAAIKNYPSHGEKVFCGRECLGSYAGKNYGFPAHKKTRNGGRPKSGSSGGIITNILGRFGRNT